MTGVLLQIQSVPGSTEFAGLRLDPQGVHKGGLFRKSVAWRDIAGTEVRHPYFRVLARAQ